MTTVVYARRLMGTDFEIKFDSPRDGLVQDLFLVGDKLEAELSAFRENSVIGRLTRCAAGEWLEMPESTTTLVRLSRHFENQTHGFFCVAGEPFEDAFEVDRSRLRKKRSDSRINFGAIGKGYVLDVWAATLAREGVDAYLLSAGGSSVLARGNWQCAWAIDRDSDGEYLGFKLSHREPSSKPWALGVSGVFEKGEHVWRTSSVRTSALVVSERATDADALSTAVLAGALLEGIPHAWFEETGELFWNLEFSKTFELSRGMPS